MSTFLWIAVVQIIVYHFSSEQTVECKMIIYGLVLSSPIPPLAALTVFSITEGEFGIRTTFFSIAIPLSVSIVAVIPVVAVSDLSAKKMLDVRFNTLCISILFHSFIYRVSPALMLVAGKGFKHSNSSQIRWDEFCEKVKEYSGADIKNNTWPEGEYKFSYREHVEIVNGRNRRKR